MVMALWQEHYNQQYEERCLYYGRRQLSLARPSQYLSIIVDACSSNLTALPAFWRKSKGLPEKFEAFGSTLYGVLVHGAEGFFGYLVDGACKGGASVTVETINRTLHKVSAARGNSLPPTLFIQVDGCVGDNKNRTLFGYAAWLVAQGHFREVNVCFLMVGHTHEDIDACFGVISRYFKALGKAIVTIAELVASIIAALAKSAKSFFLREASHVEFMRNTHDWSAFLCGTDEDPNLVEFSHFAKQVPDTHRPHHFVFTVVGGVVCMNYKHFSASKHESNTTNPGFWNREPIPMFYKVPDIQDLKPKQLRANIVKSLQECKAAKGEHEEDEHWELGTLRVPRGCMNEECPKCNVFWCFDQRGNWDPTTCITPDHVKQWVERFDHTTQEDADSSLPLFDGLPVVAPKQAGVHAILEIPDMLKPVPDDLPPPVTYQGYSLTDWKREMKTRGFDMLSMYHKKKRASKKSKKKKDDQAKETDPDQDWDCVIIGACRSAKGSIKVAVMWDDGKGSTSGNWQPLSTLVQAGVGTENWTTSFGQHREGQTVVVQWSTCRRYVGKLDDFDPCKNSFTLNYPKQGPHASLGTSGTEESQHSFRLDTLETDHPNDEGGSMVHTWWVQKEWVSLKWVCNGLEANMTDGGGSDKQEPTKARKRKQAGSDDDSSDDSSDDSGSNDDSGGNDGTDTQDDEEGNKRAHAMHAHKRKRDEARPTKASTKPQASPQPKRKQTCKVCGCVGPHPKESKCSKLKRNINLV